jgi:hypothetical protein
MTNEEAEALGRRALAAGFKGPIRRFIDGALVGVHPDEDWWPDFRDWATLGVLVGQVRERWGLAGAHCEPLSDGTAGVWPAGWRVLAGRGLHVLSRGATEAESWVAALEAAS